MVKSKAIFCWSSGKDSAYCLNKVLQEELFDVRYLLTTINDNFKRISMHGIREELLDLQAESIGIPLLKVRTTESTNIDYENQMETVLLKVKSEGILNVIFGDIFLEDLRKYREANLAKVGMNAVFPLWQMNTGDLLNDFIKKQFRAVICCTNDGYLNQEWIGNQLDNNFLINLPDNVDPCGENGEYHTFCYDGPIFKKKISFNLGEKVYKSLELKTDDSVSASTEIVTKGFWYCDLLPI